MVSTVNYYVTLLKWTNFPPSASSAFHPEEDVPISAYGFSLFGWLDVTVQKWHINRLASCC